jgi:outer membrane protein assembly factor BamB
MAGFNGPAMAFRLQGQGNITDAARLWRKESANPQSIGSGLLIAGKVYRPGAGPNLLECLDAMTGEVIWQDRTQGGAFWGSISFNGKLAYVTDQQGRTFVFEPSPGKLNILAVNELNEPTNATPALFDNSLMIRTDKSLWRIGK